MAITASSITTSNTLEQLRTQFNNLVTDVSGLESGTVAYGALSATTTNTTTLNVQEDGTIASSPPIESTSRTKPLSRHLIASFGNSFIKFAQLFHFSRCKDYNNNYVKTNGLDINCF